MKLDKFTIFLSLIIFIVANDNIFGQSNVALKLGKRNPDGWFTLLVPKIMGKVQRHADVLGGYYFTDALVIDYNFWTFENTPNWLRDHNWLSDNNATKLHLRCPRKSKKTRTWNTKIDGKRAVIQQCWETYEGYEGKDSHLVYYVTFPKVKVFSGDSFDYGMFNFTVKYKNKRYLPLAEQIVHSINFIEK